MANESRKVSVPAESRHGLKICGYRWAVGIFMLAWFVGANPESVKGQTYLQSFGSPTFSTQIPIENGYIDASNGRLHLQIPLGSFSQRGGWQIGNAFIYDSNIWTPATGSWQHNNMYDWTNGGWQLVASPGVGTPSATYSETGYCSLDGNTKYAHEDDWMWYAADGTARSFNISTEEPISACGGSSILTGAGFALDGSGYYMSVTNFGEATVYAPDGTMLGTGSIYSTVRSRDPNGNMFDDGAAGFTDTVGRTVASTSGGSGYFTITMPNAKGDSTSVYTVKTGTISVNTNFGQSGVTEYSGTMTVTTEIDLPDGTKYTFTYDCDSTLSSACGSSHSVGTYYGLPQSMTLPTGGQITYSWSIFTDSQGNKYPWISQRVTPDGTWTYSQAVVTTCGSGQINCQQTFTVQKPSTDKIVYTFALNGGAWVSEADYYTGSSTQVAKTTQCWNFVTITSGTCSYSVTTGYPSTAIQKMAASTTLPTPGSSSVSKTTQYTYDGYGNTTAIEENNYYTGALPSSPDRTTTITYQHGTNYLNALILNRPSSVTVTNGSGGTVAQANYFYDQTSLSSITGVENHDDTNFGTGNNIRGNLTQVQRLVSGSTYLNTYMTYDMTGEVLTSTDSNGNVTTYSYTDEYVNGTPPSTTNAYPTTITAPLSLATTATYYYGTGQMASSTDANGNTTSFSSPDVFNRLTTTSLPDGGWTLYQYDVSSGYVQTGVEVFTGITSTSPSSGCTGCRHDQYVLDGLGRATSQNLVSDPAGQSSIGTVYDSIGRVYSVTNPRRSGSSYTDGTEYYAYDGLDRQVQITRTDGSVAGTYFGAAVSTPGGRSSQLCSGYGLGYPVLNKDEAGNLRQALTDGFGRLIEADEPDPSTGSLTSGSAAGTCYSYDLNNNLTGVTQGSETRGFSYDLLSRLASVTTPESGTTNYYYTTSGGSLCSGDPSSVCRRVAPSPNQTSSSVTATTTYSYDALNRLTQKSYTDSYSSNPATPTEQFYYDQTSPWGWTTTNTKGRMTIEQTINGSTVLAAQAYSYDSMGRLIHRSQCTPPTCGWTGWDAQNGVYNLMGELTSFTHPGLFNITQSYDQAGHLTQINSNVSDSQHPGTLATVNSYFPPGENQKVTLGNGLLESWLYEPRLDACRINLYSSGTPPVGCGNSDPSGNIQGFGYVFGTYGSSYNGNISNWQGWSGGSQAFSRTYTYDALNRLSSLSDSVTSNPCPGLSWSYDRWGNRTAQTVTAGSCGSWSAGYSSANQITNTGFTYDADGNLTGDGVYHYMYNAENRLVQIDGTPGTCSTATACYTYDAIGNRAEKIVAGVPTEYIYDLEGNVAGDVDGSTLAPQTAYIYLNDQLLAQYTAGGWWLTPNTSTTDFMFMDHLGSTRVVTNMSGGVVDSMDYAPFGEQIAGGTTTSHKFTGYIRDGNLDNANARYYSPAMGRFMSPDPLGGDPSDPQSLNRYAYVENNPMNWVDPSGMCGEPTEQVSAGIVGSGSMNTGDTVYAPCDPWGGNAGTSQVIWTGGCTMASMGGGSGACVPNTTWVGMIQPSTVKPPAPQPQPSVTTIVNQCAGDLSQAGSVSSLSGGRVPQLLGSNTFGDIASLVTGSSDAFNQGTAVATDVTAHSLPSLVAQVGVATAATFGRPISYMPGVYNPVTVGTTTVTFGMTKVGAAALSAAEGVLSGKVLLDAGVYLGALVVCSIQ